MKTKWSMIGNDKVKEFLDLAIAKKSLANFYILSGPSNLSKFSTAKDLALNIFRKEKSDPSIKLETLINQADLLILDRELDKKDISIAQVRSLIKFFQLSSSEDSYQIAIIKEAENLNQNSANALLKLLEESSGRRLIVLTVNNLSLVPETIISRSQVISFFPVKNEIIYQELVKREKASPSMAKNLSQIAGGQPDLALYLLKNRQIYNNYQDLARDFLDFYSFNFSDRRRIIETALEKELPPGLNVLDLWELVWRDLVLINYQSDILRHPFLLEKLKNLARESFSEVKIQAEFQAFASARDLWRTNLKLESVLDYLAVNL